MVTLGYSLLLSHELLSIVGFSRDHLGGHRGPLPLCIMLMPCTLNPKPDLRSIVPTLFPNKNPCLLSAWELLSQNCRMESDMCPAFEIGCSMYIHIYYSMLQSFLFIVVFFRPFLQSDTNTTVLVTGSLIALKGAHVLLALVLSFLANVATSLLC